MHDYGKLNAIVVAGDKGKSHPVFQKNKALLEIGGVPIVERVVSALDKANSVAEIFVVGPGEKLEPIFSPASGRAKIGKPVHMFEQHTNLYDNVWYTFLETLPAYRQGKSIEAIARGPETETIALVVAADMPLLTSAEVDEFVSRCDMHAYDFVLGVTREEDLKHFYPARGKPGIRMAYMHFSAGNFRQNNMHIVRPFKILNRHYVQTMYDLRYQKEFGNILRLAWEILRREEGGWSAVGNYLLLQLSLLFARLRLGILRDLVRRKTHVGSVVKCISQLMKTRFSIACTSIGGAALDIDSEHEYDVIEQRFTEWMMYQEEKAKRLLTRVSPQ